MNKNMAVAAALAGGLVLAAAMPTVAAPSMNLSGALATGSATVQLVRGGGGGGGGGGGHAGGGGGGHAGGGGGGGRGGGGGGHGAEAGVSAHLGASAAAHGGGNLAVGGGRIGRAGESGGPRLRGSAGGHLSVDRGGPRIGAGGDRTGRHHYGNHTATRDRNQHWAEGDGKHHHGRHHYRRYYNPDIFVYGGGGYASYDDCDWLRRKASLTGSSYWWRRYKECEYYD